MSDVSTFSTQDVEALATKLDGWDGLDDADRATLAAVFSLAGQAAGAPDEEVTGFAHFITVRKAGGNQPEFLSFRPGFEYGGRMQGAFTNGLNGLPPDPVSSP